MRHLIVYTTLLIVACFTMQSCTEDTTALQNSESFLYSDFKVINLAATNNKTRIISDSVINALQILQFNDQAAYERMLAKVRAMDENEKINFFQSIGFDGAYMLLQRADQDFEEAFDKAEVTDSITGEQEIRSCLAKYDGVLLFNPNDEYDVTPALPFEDEDALLLGNINGNVMIGNRIVSPRILGNNSPFFVAYPKSETKVTNNKYTSYFRLGRAGINMAFKLETYRRILLFKKYDKKCEYQGELLIAAYTNNNREQANFRDRSGVRLLHSYASAYTPNVSMKLTNFCCSRNWNNKVSKSAARLIVM